MITVKYRKIGTKEFFSEECRSLIEATGLMKRVNADISLEAVDIAGTKLYYASPFSKLFYRDAGGRLAEPL